MNIRLLKNEDVKKLEEYLSLHKAECMFMGSNLQASGIEYKGGDFEGEYFCYFDKSGEHEERLLGVIVHYWNGNIMMHASNHTILEQLIWHLKKNIKRPVAGILGPNIQAESVLRNLGFTRACFSINSNEGLYEINLEALNEFSMSSNMSVVAAQDIPKRLLIQWMKNYDIEALGASNDETVEQKVEEHWNRRLKKNDSWVLLLDGIPVALSAFNARFRDMVQIGPVWTPPEYRNKGFARLLLAYTLNQEKLKGTNKAILFTDNPSAIKAYLAIGFRKIGDYRLALLEKPTMVQEIEFTLFPSTTDVDFLTRKINAETREFREAYSFSFFMRDENNQIIDGCNGSVIFGSIYTDQLWVDPDHRKFGWGHKLMEAVHEYGLQNKCSMATVASMSFQGAKSFYEKLGYVVDFERLGYAQGSSCLFMRKEL